MARSNVLSYAQSGVDRGARRAAKKFGAFAATMPKGTLKLPYNNLYPAGDAKGSYFLLTVDGVGTKILVAELAGKHAGIGVDGVAMVVNDCIRCGAHPVALADTIDIHHSEPKLLSELVKGIGKGAREAGCAVVGGETADVPSMVSGLGSNPYSLNMSCYGTVAKGEVVKGDSIKPGDAIIGLRSSGLHSNGLSLARRARFKKWGGRYDAWAQPEGLNKPIAEEVLTPTRIYVKPVLEAMEKFSVRGAVNVTGDGYAKFNNLARASGVGFRLNNFRPQRIFSLIQDSAKVIAKWVPDEEMFLTFNMGWGFALAVPKGEADGTIGFLERKGVEADVIGEATKQSGVVIEFNSRKFRVV